MKRVYLKPVSLDPRDDLRAGPIVLGTAGRPHAPAANDNRRSFRSLVRFLLGRALMIMPPLVAAALIIYVMSN